LQAELLQAELLIKVLQAVQQVMVTMAVLEITFLVRALLEAVAEAQAS
jgi:hypothetical protein